MEIAQFCKNACVAFASCVKRERERENKRDAFRDDMSLVKNSSRNLMEIRSL